MRAIFRNLHNASLPLQAGYQMIRRQGADHPADHAFGAEAHAYEAMVRVAGAVP